MLKPNVSRSYAAINDDVRHTYERVFYGRQLTDNLTTNDVPGMLDDPSRKAAPGSDSQAGTVWGHAPGEASPAAAPGSVWGEPTHDERIATADAYDHAANAPGIRAEINDVAGHHPYPYADAPDRPNTSADLYGPTPEGPANSPPAPEPSAPTAGNDMTPG